MKPWILLSCQHISTQTMHSHMSIYREAYFSYLITQCYSYMNSFLAKFGRVPWNRKQIEILWNYWNTNIKLISQLLVLVSVCMCYLLWKSRVMCEVLTANLQLALHSVLSTVVNGFTHVHTSIEWTRLPDLQSQNALLAEHAVFGFVCDVHLVLVPCYFGLSITMDSKIQGNW